MRIAIFSDLHIDHGPSYRAPVVDADVIVLAGDLWTGSATAFVDAIGLFRAANPQTPVIAVMGNHDPWGHDVDAIVPAWKAALAGDPLAHFLYRDTVAIGDYHFVGATLWTSLANPILRQYAELVMNDYRRIRVGGRKLKPRHIDSAHRADLHAVRTAMETHGQRLVVVTHHAPSRRSFSHHNDDDSTEMLYSNTLDALIEQHGPAAWIHGHTHVRHDYTIGRTRVVTNPRGYFGYPSAQAFEQAGFVIELP